MRARKRKGDSEVEKMEQPTRVITEAAKLVPIDSIHPHPSNPSQGDVGAIIESIRANGFYGVIIAQKSSNTIIVGEHRWRASKDIGMKNVPVAFADVDDATAIKIMLADNRISDLADWNYPMLSELLSSIVTTGIGLDGSGYDEDALDAISEGLKDKPKKERKPTDYRCPKCGHMWSGKPASDEVDLGS